MTSVSESKSTLLPLSHCGDISIVDNNISGVFHAIDFSLWQSILSFHREVSKAIDAESISYHAWNEDAQTYDTIIPYQLTNSKGLSVDVDWEDKRNIELLDDFAQKNGRAFPWPYCCTIHTHVNAAAFESGTDAADEADLPGWHMTIGHLLSHNKIDLHTRLRLPKLKHVTELTDTTTAYDFSPALLFDVEINRVECCNRTENTFHEHFDRIYYY